MKKTLFLLAILFALAAPGRADDGSSGKEYLEDAVNPNRLFVIETTEESAAESLNRITGDYDRGFSTPDSSYQSASHRGALGSSSDDNRTTSLSPGYSY